MEDEDVSDVSRILDNERLKSWKRKEEADEGDGGVGGMAVLKTSSNALLLG